MTDGNRLAARARQLGDDLMSGLEPRWSHVRAVASQVEQLSLGLSHPDRDAVLAAAWLHDIGYAQDLAVTSMHALDGARYLQQQGWTATVCSLVAFHTGATYEAEERELSESLAMFAPPPAHLLDILTAADVTSGPSGAVVTAEGRVAEILERYDAENPVHRAVRRSAPELVAAVARTQRRIAEAAATRGEGQPT